MEQTLSENRRIIAVGDIHGCLHSLGELLRKLELQDSDQIVFLGDYISRGPGSKAVVDFLLGQQQQYACFFIMGNHEQMYLHYLETGDPGNWLDNGGLETLRSYRNEQGDGQPAEHLDFLKKCRFFLETEHYFFTHGGLDPAMSVKDNLRHYNPDRFCWQRRHMRASLLAAGSFPWEKTVVCAHTPVPEPILLDRLIAIDTGCIYHNNPLFGKLTAVVLPERRIVQTGYLD